MSDQDEVRAAIDLTSKARVRLAAQIDAVLKRAMVEDAIGSDDVVIVLEDCKFRELMRLYNVERRELL